MRIQNSYVAEHKNQPAGRKSDNELRRYDIVTHQPRPEQALRQPETFKKGNPWKVDSRLHNFPFVNSLDRQPHDPELDHRRKMTVLLPDAEQYRRFGVQKFRDDI